MLSPNISVTDDAGDLSLLTVAELRSAVNISGASQDVALGRLGLRVAAAITAACKVASDGINPPTLREEAITETIRRNWRYGMPREHLNEGAHTLYLSRRPVTTVASVIESGVTLDPSMYEIHAAAGAIVRLNNDIPCQWARGKIVVAYIAGWDDIPDGLKRAAEQLMQIYWSQQANDPLVKQISIPGVIERQFWIGSSSDPAIPQDVMDDLGPYINLLV